MGFSVKICLRDQCLGREGRIKRDRQKEKSNCDSLSSGAGSLGMRIANKSVPRGACILPFTNSRIPSALTSVGTEGRELFPAPANDDGHECWALFLNKSFIEEEFLCL